jgi:hypothetical protein
MRSPLHALIGAAALAALLTAPPLAAQGLGWDVKSDASVSLFFGNTEQRVVTTHGALGHADSTFDLQTDARFSYGEASADSGERTVNKRSWLASVSFNHHPFMRFSPFFSGSIESSLEKRIDLRYNAGLGGKVAFIRNDATDFNFTLALLGERTIPAADQADAESTTLLRWASSLTFKHKIDDKLSVKNETSYRPSAPDISEFTFTSTSSLGYAMNHSVGLMLSVLDNYDSQAKSRGARSNNDGQLLFGVQTTF